MTSREIDEHNAAARVVRARIDNRRTAIMPAITLFNLLGILTLVTIVIKEVF